MNCINIVVKPDELCFKLNNFSYKFLSTITRVYTYNMPCFKPDHTAKTHIPMQQR